MTKRPFRVIALLLLTVFAAGIVLAAESAPQPSSPYSQWANGPGKDASYFPIAVWLQNPNKAAEYRKAGINLYVGLWKGPTDDQLSGAYEGRHARYLLAKLRRPRPPGRSHHRRLDARRRAG